MTEAIDDRRMRGDGETGPFRLERSSVHPQLPPHDDDRAQNASSRAASLPPDDLVLELVSRRSDAISPATDTADATKEDAPTAPAVAEEDAAPAPTTDTSMLRLDRAGRRAARLLTWALAFDALVLFSLAFAGFLRVTRGGAGAPDLLVGSVAFVLALPCALGAQSLLRLGRGRATATTDARRFAQGIGHLRAIFVIKATVLFTTLGLGCFAFSLVASLLAFL